MFLDITYCSSKHTHHEQKHKTAYEVSLLLNLACQKRS